MWAWLVNAIGAALSIAILVGILTLAGAGALAALGIGRVLKWIVACQPVSQ